MFRGAAGQYRLLATRLEERMRSVITAAEANTYTSHT
jgi:hypothetical protein